MQPSHEQEQEAKEDRYETRWILGCSAVIYLIAVVAGIASLL